MGLGKTLSALTAGYQRGLTKRTIVTCSGSALSVWPKEVKKWFPELTGRVVVVEGTKAKRRKLWEEHADKEEIIMVCTYGVYMADSAIIPTRWDLHIGDEAHKARNHKSKTYYAVTKIVSDDLYLITGTPAPKGVQHMFGYLHWLFPKQFTSYWKFINTYCVVEEGPFGKEIVGSMNMDKFKEILSTIMIRRKKSSNMPVKRRHILDAVMTAEEERIYKQIDTEQIYNRADGSYLLTPSAMSARLRCRQLFICPQLLDPALGSGSGLDLILEHADDNELNHFVIFTPFPAAFPFLRKRIWERLQVSAHELKGGMDSTTVAKTIEDWSKAEKGVMLVSIKFATSFELTKASTGYMLGYEWDPDDNYQAEDRLHRMGITEDVNIYYVFHDNVLAKRQKEIADLKYHEGVQMGL